MSNQFPQPARRIKRAFLVLLIGVAGLFQTSCQDESLVTQTVFPFTVTTETIPTSVPKGGAATFELVVKPQRLTTTSNYTLRWRNLSALTGTLRLNGLVLTSNQPVVLANLTARLAFTGETAGSYSVELTITDQSGISQVVTFAVTTV